jgi:O-antigen/teichoic acid export membrane protein
VLRIGSSFLFHLLSARVLGPGGYGVLSHTVSGGAVVQQATDLGVGPAVGVGLARAKAGPGELEGSGRRLVWAGLGVKVVLVVSAVILFLGFPAWPTRLFGEGMAVWGTLLGVLTGVAILAEYAAIGWGQTRLLPIGSVAVFVLPVMAAVVAVLVRGTPVSAVATWAVGMVIGVAVFWTLLVVVQGKAPSGEESSRSGVRRLLKTAGYLGVVNLGAVLMNRAPVIALGALGHLSGAGIMGAGIAIVERGALLGTAVGLSAGSALSAWLSGGRHLVQARRAMRTGSEYAVWLAAILASSGPLGISVFLGSQYGDLVRLTPLLGVAVFLLSTTQMIGALLDFGGWARQRAFAALAGSGIVLLLLAGAGSSLDPVRSVVAVTAGLAGSLGVVNLLSLGREHGGRVRSLMLIAAVDLIRVLLVVMLVTLSGARFGGLGTWTNAIVVMPVCLAVVAATGWRRDWVTWPGPVNRLIERIASLR